jgi:hypothetical protein
MVRAPPLLVFAALVVATDAEAEERARAHLFYTRTPGCPEEARVRAMVRSRLGYDPFVDDAHAENVVELRLERRGESFSGTVDVTRGGASQGTRELTSRDCDELASSLSVTVAVGVDPLSLTGPAPAPPPSPAPTPPSTASAPSRQDDPFATAERPAPPPPVEPRGRELRVHAGPLISIGTSPSANAGLAIGAGARWRSFSLGGEGRIDFPLAPRSMKAGGEISSSVLLGSVVPCLHAGFARGCGLLTAGVLRGAGEGVDHPRQTSNFFSAVGVRAGMEIALAPRLAIGAHGDLLAALTHITFQLDRANAWSTPPVSGVLGLDLTGTF